MINNTLKQFGKFAVVGVANTLVDLAVLTFLIYLEPSGRAGVLYALFKAIAFIIANLNSYLFNKFWTFKGEGGEKKTSVEFSQYFIVSVIGMLINVGVATAVVTYVIPPFSMLEKYWPQVGALFGTAFGLIWNFVGYKFVVFVRRNKQSPMA